MFDNIGWAEIAVLIIVALIIIGPERLPGVIKDVRAAIFAARRAIANARAELDGDFGEEFNELKAPISQAAEWGRRGPKAAITKALFDGDEDALNDFDPRQIIAGSGVDPSKETPAQAARRLRRQADALEKSSQNSQTPPQESRLAGGKSGQAGKQPGKSRPARKAGPAPQSQTESAAPEKGNFETGGGFSWSDIT